MFGGAARRGRLGVEHCHPRFSWSCVGEASRKTSSSSESRILLFPPRGSVEGVGVRMAGARFATRCGSGVGAFVGGRTARDEGGCTPSKAWSARQVPWRPEARLGAAQAGFDELGFVGARVGLYAPSRTSGGREPGGSHGSADGSSIVRWRLGA